VRLPRFARNDNKSSLRDLQVVAVFICFRLPHFTPKERAFVIEQLFIIPAKAGIHYLLHEIENYSRLREDIFFEKEGIGDAHLFCEFLAD